MDNEQVKILLEKIRDPFFTTVRRTTAKNLADDLLKDYGSPEELREKYALYIALLVKLLV